MFYLEGLRMKKRLFAAVSAAMILFCGCGSSTYKAEGLSTSNGSDGWTCTFDSLDGDYTNTFPINGSSIRIDSEVGSGNMEIVLKANGETETLDGNYSGAVPVEKFGKDYLYITFSAENAQNGSVHIVWEE